MLQLQKDGVDIDFYKPNQQYDIVIFSTYSCYQKDGDSPMGAGVIEAAKKIKAEGSTIIVDQADNQHYNPHQYADLAEGSEAIIKLQELADCITTPSEHLASLIQKNFPSKPTHVVGDAIEKNINNTDNNLIKSLLSYGQWKDRAAYYKLASRIRKNTTNGITPLVWYGTMGSRRGDAGGIKDLDKIRSAIENVDKDHPLSLTIISNSENRYEDVMGCWNIKTYYLKWSWVNFIQAMHLHEIAVLPFNFSPWTEGKSNNRMTLALSLGLSVVADPIESYREFENACFLGNWETGIRSYIENPLLQEQHLHEGNKIIEENYTIKKISDRWNSIFNQQGR